MKDDDNVHPLKLLSLALFLVIGCAPENNEASSVALQSNTVDETRIEKIETSLSSAIIIAGENNTPMTLAARMSEYQTPGVSLAFFDRDGIRWSRAYGFADNAQNQSLSTEHKFQAASISKALTAIAVMRLVDRGDLDLDTDIRVYLKSWVPSWETELHPITLRHLLSHSAGLSVHGFEGYAQGATLPKLDQSLDGTSPANNDPVVPISRAGAGFSYSGGGYLIVQKVLEDTTELPFADLMDELVLQPAGMWHSTFLLDQIDGHYADAYVADGGTPEGGWNVYPESAAAGLWTTPSDLANLGALLLKARAGEAQKFLNTASMDTMTALAAGNWALGFRVDPDGTGTYFGHGGNNVGFSSDFLVVANADEGVVIMTNGDAKLGALVGEIRMAVATTYEWEKLGPEVRTLAEVPITQLAAYTGTYRQGEDFTFSIALDGEYLMIDAAPSGPIPVRLYPQTDRRFYILPSGLPFEFYEDETNQIKGVKIGSQKAIRIAP